MERNILDDSIYDIEKEYQRVSYAGFGQRLIAAFIDGLLFVPLVLINTYLIVSTGSFVASLLTIVASLAYKPLMEGNYGATLGKMALNIKVVNSQHQVINMEESLTRNSPWIVSNIAALLSLIVSFGTISSMLTSIQGLASLFIFISAIYIIFDENKQALHDKFANTYCILN